MSRNDLNAEFGKRLTRNRKASAGVFRSRVVRILIVAVTAYLLFFRAT